MKQLFIAGIVASGIILSACNKKPAASPAPLATPTPSPLVTTGVPVQEKGVSIEIPEPGFAIASPVEIKGFAPGSWFFEGQIQGQLISEAGKVVSTFPLKATDNWMTSEHVPFEGTAEFEVPKTDAVIHLVIKNDNPSGLPENEQSQTFDYVLEQ